MAIFIDTGVFVAAVNIADKNHKRAKELMEKALKGEFGVIYTSDYVIDETVAATLAGVKKLRPAIEVGEFVLGSPRIRRLRVSEEVFDAAWGKFKSLGERLMSFTDCTSLVLMEENGINDIISFDSGFDGLVSRLHGQEFYRARTKGERGLFATN